MPRKQISLKIPGFRNIIVETKLLKMACWQLSYDLPLVLRHRSDILVIAIFFSDVKESNTLEC